MAELGPSSGSPSLLRFDGSPPSPREERGEGRLKKLRPTVEDGRPRRARSATGRGGDVTGIANCLPLLFQRDDAVEIVGRWSPRETQRFGSVCDWRFTK